ncbi:hypothetical protein KFK09_028417 [Dendrobium nobile]|uniref:Uncharacterized protein n=1 Tax=Dendrobium nobile TaxID=94219 RepID=A0A8T3A3A6_DENNO|nr:hypothetical protein KFK09_028417 [Dendrobium nobile]
MENSTITKLLTSVEKKKKQKNPSVPRIRRDSAQILDILQTKLSNSVNPADLALNELRSLR